MKGAMSSVVPTLGFIDFLGGPELMMVLVIALLLFGGDKLPELAKGIGKSMREFRKATGAVQDELRRAMDEFETETPSIMPPKPTSPEIKSTPGIQPPGATPAAPLNPPPGPSTLPETTAGSDFVWPPPEETENPSNPSPDQTGPESSPDQKSGPN